ncbi:cytidylate kinase family protein [Candidatus Woesearchaeota archaeon]|nr:cytidylate kinase family protein [Candidatus Woesearchaeota archaeon]
MIITIAGYPGSGKSLVGQLLAKKLNYKYYSIGDMRGEIARKHGMTIDELNKVGEKEAWTDVEVDQWQQKLGWEKDNLVMDGRTSFHFIPSSVKVLLKVSWEEGARRIMAGKARSDEHQAKSIQERVKQSKARVASDKVRYMKHYGIDPCDEKNFDVVIDTTTMSPQEVVDAILKMGGL